MPPPNGKNPRGRQPICPGEESVPITVRVAASDYDLFDELARRHHVSIPKLIRNFPIIVRELLAQIKTLQADLDAVISRLTATATDEEKSQTFFRLLICHSLTYSEQDPCGNKVAAVVSFLERCPTDIHAPLVRGLLGKFHQANAVNPGSVTEEELWAAIGMSRGNPAERGTRPI